ncbi:hypothetical protein JTE90_011234 [Oedothorax gibbosus]|uniref:Microtubule-associated protein Jupiter n=1 Tax=Oedothorax gibbosus TaxID=931172 RepID=A0AAV6W0M1_9ARAC|nr:hypothetical protein JTE90_011234 [Oedothorax gibbosus]
MTSTEFTIGLNGTRVSSKVLRPPGGGASDIFGLGPRQYDSNTNGNANKPSNNSTASNNTQNRLFGTETEVATPSKSQVKSNVFENEMQAVTKSTKKQYVRRNPITGEEIIMNPESNETEKDDNEEETKEKQENGDEEKKTEVPVKTVQTSIRIRNPPGGKSSIFF